MAEITPNDPLAEKTRSNIAYLFTLGSIAMLAYILYMWGGKTEILTLIIGLIGGTLLGSVSGVYFGGSSSAKKPDNSPVINQTGETQVTNVGPLTPPAE
jgi:hypothetical protein